MPASSNLVIFWAIAVYGANVWMNWVRHISCLLRTSYSSEWLPIKRSMGVGDRYLMRVVTTGYELNATVNAGIGDPGTCCTSSFSVSLFMPTRREGCDNTSWYTLFMAAHVLRYSGSLCKIIQNTNKCKECAKEKCKYDAYLKIKNGNLLCGVVDKSSLGEVSGQIIDTLARNYPSEIIEEFYNKINRVVADLLTKRGMTAGVDEYEVSDHILKAKEKAVEEMYTKGKVLTDRFEKGTLEHLPGKTLRESFEAKMMKVAAETKKKVEHQIMKEKLDSILKEEPKLNTMIMIASGSRGSSINLMNISGFWGQANVREGRPRRGFTNRLITSNEKNDVGVKAGGFISSNFIDGMDAKEYFYHSMGGRQGEVDTGVSTKVSGYLYRRLANSLKDLVVNNDKTVRTASSELVQYSYGEDGVFTQNTIKGKNIDVEKEAKDMKE